MKMRKMDEYIFLRSLQVEMTNRVSVIERFGICNISGGRSSEVIERS